VNLYKTYLFEIIYCFDCILFNGYLLQPFTLQKLIHFIKAPSLNTPKTQSLYKSSFSKYQNLNHFIKAPFSKYQTSITL